jgi:hypothetical protein
LIIPEEIEGASSLVAEWEVVRFGVRTAKGLLDVRLVAVTGPAVTISVASVTARFAVVGLPVTRLVVVGSVDSNPGAKFGTRPLSDGVLS